MPVPTGKENGKLVRKTAVRANKGGCRKTSHVGRGQVPRQVADDATAQGDHRGVTRATVLQHEVLTEAGRSRHIIALQGRCPGQKTDSMSQRFCYRPPSRARARDGRI